MVVYLLQTLISVLSILLGAFLKTIWDIVHYMSI